MTTHAHRRMVLFGASLVLMGALGGCQAARYRTACATPEQPGYATTTLPPASQPTPRPNPPFLRGPSEPVPLATPGSQPNPPAFPPERVERRTSRGTQGGPALNADSDERSDDEAVEDYDADQPIFPKTGRRPVQPSAQPRASVDPPGRATLSSSTRVVEPPAAPERAPRHPLPVTRRLPSTVVVPRTEPANTEWESIPQSMPIPLRNPPALLTPPT